MKEAYIELMDYNVLLSLLEYFQTSMDPYTINGKKINISSSYSDIKNKYIVPAISLEILYRKNRSIGFNNFYGDQYVDDEFGASIVEIDGTMFEYRIQMNVYSNTRGENYKWASILDQVLKNGESGIPINTYDDGGNIKQSAIGNMDYDFSQDIKSNGMNPNIETYDFHTIYEIKSTALQKYTVRYDMMEIGNIIGKLK